MRKPSVKLFALFLAILGILSTRTSAWIDTGHRVVAFVAWEDLTPKTKAAVTAILKQHPRYEKDLLEGAPADETPDEQDRTAFAKAATWPDMVRSMANPMNHRDNHPSWHYIDIPYSIGGAVPPPEPTTGPLPLNIVGALKQCTAELKDSKTTDADKAVDICWIEHLAGDIHQPLHAVSLFTPELPNGDKGGNALYVLKDIRYRNTMTNLHLLWDSLPGDFRSEEFSIYEAHGLRADPNYSREKMKTQIADTDFMDWARESHQLAVEVAYLNGNLKYALAPEHGQPDANNVPGVPADYMQKAEHVAMQRVTLAGYRLADLLNSTFDPK